MECRTTYEIFILPIIFKTISFHHRSLYTIQIHCSNAKVIRSSPVTPDFMPRHKIIDDRSGNIEGILGTINCYSKFETGIDVTNVAKYQIDYNEQSVKFSSGVLLQVEYNDLEPLVVTL